MSNSLLEDYRSQVPKDTRSDDELISLFGQAHDKDGRYSGYPDFVAQYQKAKATQREANAPSYPQEFGMGVKRGTAGLQGSLYGAGALAANLVGANETRDALIEKARDAEAAAADNAATVPKYEDIKTAGDAVRYGLGGVGEVVPSIAEAGVMGVAGAVAGSAAGPSGTGGGLLAGVLWRRAGKALIDKKIKNITTELIAKEAASMAARYGGSAVSALNSYGLSAGEIYNDLLAQPGVDKSKAAWTAAGFGAVAAAPDTILPAFVLGKFFKGAVSEAEKEAGSKYLIRFAKDFSKTVPLEATTEGFQEVVGIAASRYARNVPVDAPLSDEEWSRVKNASILGAFGGGIVAPVSAIPGGRVTADEINEANKVPIEHGYTKPITEPDAENISKVVEKEKAGEITKEQAKEELPSRLHVAHDTALDLFKVQRTPVIAPSPEPPAVQPEPPLDNTVAKEIADAESETNTNPTEAQQEAGNFKKGRVSIDGFNIAIENPVGTERTKMGSDGKQWTVTMPATYGYFSKTESKDGGEVDVYVGPTPESGTVFVIDQINPEKNVFDEHKVMFGFQDEASAIAAYDAAFSDGKGPSRRGAITAMPKEEFRTWLDSGDTSKAMTWKKEVSSDGQAKTSTAQTEGRQEKGLLTRDQSAPNATAQADPEYSEDVLYHGTNRKFDNFEAGVSGNAGNVKGRPVGGRFYFTEDPSIAGNIAEAGAGKQVSVDRWMEENEYDSDDEGLDKLRQAIQSQMDKGAVVSAMNDNGNMRWIRSASELKTYELLDSARVYYPNKKLPRVLKSTIKGKTLDLKKPYEQWPDWVRALVKKPVGLDFYWHDNKADLYQAAKARGYAKVKVADSYESGGSSVIVFPEFIESFSEFASDALPQGYLNDEPKPVVPVVPPVVVDHPMIAEIDFEKAFLKEQSGRMTGVKDGKAKTSYPAYHDKMVSTEFTPELGEQLTSEASPGQSDAKTATRRATAFENQETGEVHVLGTYKRTEKGAAKYFVSGGKRLDQFLGEKTSTGEQLWVPIASTLMKVPRKNYKQVFAGAKEFESSVGDIAKSRIVKVKSDAAALETTDTAYGEEAGEVVLEAPESKDMSVEFGEMVTEWLPRDSKGKIRNDLTQSSIAEALLNAFSQPENGEAQMFAVREAFDLVKDDPEFKKSKPEDQQKAILKKIIQLVYEAYKNGGFSEERTAIQGSGQTVVGTNEGFGSQTPGTLRPGDSGETVYSSESEPGAADSKGWIEIDGGVEEFAPDAEVERRYSDAVSAASDAGLDVWIFPSVIKGIYSGFGGRYFPKRRLIATTIADAVSPTPANLKTLIHEIAHSVSLSETPETRAKIYKAISRLTDKDLSIQFTADSRIKESNPSNLSPETLLEERLVESIAIELFPKDVARGFAQAILRKLKAIWYRTAMAAADFLGVPSEAARDYVRTRVEQLLARDNAAIQNVITFWGGGKPSVAKQAKLFKPVDGGFMGERFNSESGEIETPLVIPESVASAIWNLREAYRSEPGERKIPRLGDREHKGTIANIQHSVFNEQLEQEKMIAVKLAEHAEFKAMSNGDPMKFFRRIFGIEDPEALKQAQKDRRDMDNDLVNQNPDQRIDDFKGSHNLDQAQKMAYQLFFSKIIPKVENAVRKFHESRKEAEVKRDKDFEVLKASKERYLDIEGQTAEIVRTSKVMFRQIRKDLARESKNLGIVTQQLKDLDPIADIPARYSPVFQKLFTGGQLDGKNLFKFLDQMANDPTIDFNLSISKIRKEMANASIKIPGLYSDLIQDNLESKALLSTVVAYAKTNHRMMALIELRRAKSGEERAKINAQIKELFAEGEGKTLETIAKTSALEERVKNAYRQDLNKVRSSERTAKRMAAQAAAGEIALDYYGNRASQLAGDLGLHADVHFGHGMKYVVPEEVPGVIGYQLKESVVSLSATGEITEPAKIRSDTDKMAAWLVEKGAKGEWDADYRMVKAMHDELLIHGVFSKPLITVNKTITGLKLSAEAAQASSTGGPAGRMFEQLVNKFTAVASSLRNDLDRMATKATVAQQKALRILGPKFSLDYYLEHFYSPSAQFIKRQIDLSESVLSHDEQLKEAYKRLRSYLMNGKMTGDEMLGKEDEFMAALRAHIEANVTVSKYVVKKNEDAALGVMDDDLKVKDVEGKSVSGVRRYLDVGPVMISEMVSQNFRAVFEEMRKAGWPNADFSRFADDFLNNPDETGNIVRALFTDKDPNSKIIQNLFLGAIANKDTTTPFYAPVMADGVTRAEADPALVGQAWLDSGGDPIEFARILGLLHKPDMNPQEQAKYMQHVFEMLKGMHGEMSKTTTIIDPDSMGVAKSFENMIPGVMINAIRTNHWPSEWKTTMSFDSVTRENLINRIAAQQVFGRNSERLALANKTMLADANADLEKLKSAEKRVARSLPTTDRKTVEKALAKEFGVDGEKELKRLRNQAQKIDMLHKIQGNLVDLFRAEHGGEKSLRLMEQIFKTLIGGILNQPGSALGQVVAAFDPILAFGLSGETVKHTGGIFADVAADLSKSIGQAIGLSFDLKTQEQQDFVRLGMHDPQAVVRLKDALTADFKNEHFKGRTGYVAKKLAQLRLIQSVGVNRAGDAATATVLKPLAPFIMAVQSINRAMTQNTWKQVKNMVMDIRDKMGATIESDRSYNVTAADLGLTGLKKETFEKITEVMFEKFGLNITDLAREAIARNRTGLKTVLSDRSLVMLSGMAMNEVSSEPNFATMNSAAWNSSALRFMLPLQGWPFRRAMRIGGLRLDPKGQASMKALRTGLLALAAVSAGGLAMGMLIDEYNEEFLGKKRNLRGLFGQPDAFQTSLAAIEQLNRIGALGTWGDLANSMVNVGTGQGDNRGLSLDQRVVFMSTLTAFTRGISAYINQDFTYDYANVGRPLFASMGGNGMLQYLQIGNNFFGWDNAEARVSSRINASNYLRAAGRSLGMDLASGRGGESTPTPVTPYLSRMTMAALANDPGDFSEAYRDAIEAARKMGKPDPQDYVRRAFATKNPLRGVFKTPPSKEEFYQVLAELPSNGREAVSQAVSMHNHFLVQIGGKPYEGKEEKVKETKPFDLRAVRMQAIAPQKSSFY